MLGQGMGGFVSPCQKHRGQRVLRHQAAPAAALHPKKKQK